MNSRWILPFLVASLCVLTLSMLFLSRRPLCIDSRVVERIDRANESVFQCSQNRHIPYSIYFTEYLPRIEARVQQVESFLDRIAPMTSKIRLVIVKDPGSYFLIQGNTVYIGEDMLAARGHIEKALLKKWYRENSQNLFAYEGLFEEVFTDFMIYLVKGNLKLEDPFRGVQTKLNGSRWPQVLKSAQAYCQSPWKRSEHYKFCQDSKSRAELKNDQILMRHRGAGDIWQGLYDLPLIEQSEASLSADDVRATFGSNVGWNSLMALKHLLTHQTIFIQFFVMENFSGNFNECSGMQWVPLQDLAELPMPIVIHNFLETHLANAINK
ncbi:MAG: hypothetical protein EOP04_24125 [Proteobacteria bacterium]|nr:MAG: hypothetical protein EOP04_24125 [Pseudomonadota bacterium]